MKRISIFLSVFSIIVLVSCTAKKDNPFDINGENYTPPSLTIDWANTSIIQNSVLTVDSIYITVIGNTLYNEYRFGIDGTYWHAWSTSPLFREKNLDDGNYIIYLQTRYPNNTDSYTDSIKILATILPATAVYVSPYKQYITYGDTADITICTKGISAAYMMHCVVSGATIVKDSLLYTTGANAGTLTNNNIVDVVVLNDSTPITGNCTVLSLSLANITVSGTVGLSCVLRDKDNTAVSVDIVRGCVIVQTVSAKSDEIEPVIKPGL